MEISDMRARLDAVLLRLRLTGYGMFHPLVMAAEAAVVGAAAPVHGPEERCFAAMQALPPSATVFERGLAAGMALCLATDP